MKAKLIFAVALVLIAAFALTGAAAAANSASDDFLKGPMTPIILPITYDYVTVPMTLSDVPLHQAGSEINSNANPGVVLFKSDCSRIVALALE